MFGLKRNMLKGIGTGDVVHFADGTTAKVELVRSTSEDGEFVELQFDTMLCVPVLGHTTSSRYSNVCWYNKSTGKLAFEEWYNIKKDREDCTKHIVKVDKRGTHLCYTTAKEMIEAKYGTIEPCMCEHPLRLDDRNELHGLSELKAGDRITFRDGQTVTATEVDYAGGGQYCITFNKKVRMKEPSGIMVVDFEISRQDGTVTLKDWKNKDIVDIQPADRKQTKNDQKTGIDASILREGDQVVLGNGGCVLVRNITPIGSDYFISLEKELRGIFGNDVIHCESLFYNKQGIPVNPAWEDRAEIIKIIKADNTVEPAEVSELEALKAEVAELKKQLASLTTLKENAKKPEVTDDGNMRFVNKIKTKKKGKPNAD